MSNLLKKAIAGFSSAAMVLSMVVVPATASAATPGEVYSTTDGTVWFITKDMQKRPFTSAGAFLSYGFLSFSQVKPADASVTALPTGAFIPPADGKIFCATETKGSDVKGECSLVTGGQKAAFTSAAVFTGLGFSFSRALYGDSSFLNKTTNIDNTSDAHRPGVLVNNGGTVQMVVNGGLWGIPSLDVFNSWGYSFSDVVPANNADKAMTQIGVIPARMAGELVPTGTTGPINPPSTGSNVTISAGSMKPAATVPQSSTAVEVGQFQFTAPSNGAITLSSITVKRSGVGSTSDISNAYLYDGSERLVSGRTFNSSTNEATFTLSLQIPANSTKTLRLLVSFAAQGSGNTHSFSIASASAVNATGASVTGSFPISTNTFTLSGTAGGTVALTKTGSPSNPTVGQADAKISEFTLNASTEDAMLNQITLTQGGSVANSVLTNFELKQSGTTVASTPSVDSKGRINLVFNPSYKLEKGNQRVFELYADLNGGRPSDTVLIYIEENADLMATGGTFGFGMGTTISTLDTSSEAHQLTLQGGQFTITFGGPASANISNTGNDIVLWRGAITSVNAVEVRNWRFRLQDLTAGGAGLCESSSSCHVQDIKLWNLDNNTVIAGPVELTPAADLGEAGPVTLTFTDDFSFSTNQTVNVGLSVDIRENPASSVLSLQARMGDGTNSFTANDIKNANSNTFLSLTTDIAPSTEIVGNTQTVVAGGLTVSTAPSPTDNTMVKGTANAEVTAFNFAAGSGSAVKVNSVTVTAGMSDTDDNAYGASGGADGSSASVNGLILSAKLMDGNQQVGTTKSFSSGSATFDNLNWTLNASETKKLSVLVSTNSAATLNGGSDFLRISLETNAVSAVDSPQGNTVTVTGIPANSAEGAGDIVVTVTSAGSLIASLAPNPTNPAEGIHAAGSTDKVLAAFKFEATNESFAVKKFNLRPLVAGSSSAASNDRISQLRVRYKNQAGTTVTQTVGLSGTDNTVDISANPLYVAQNSTTTTLEVLADLSNFSILDGTEAENITFALDADNTATVNQATGIGSNTDDNSWGAADLNGSRQNVYRTVLTAAKGTANDGDAKARSSNDKVASYTFTSSSSSANAVFRGSKKGVDGATTGWAATGTGAPATNATGISLSSSVQSAEDGTSAVNDHFDFDFGASAGLENYNRLSFMIRSSAAKADGDLGVSVSSTRDATDDATLNGLGTVTTNNVNIGALAANEWERVDIAGPFVSTDRFVTFNIKANPDNAAVISIDDLRFYNDSINLDVSGSLGSAGTIKGLRFDLKNSGGTIQAYGSYDGTAATGDVLLIPGNASDVTSVTTYGDIEIGTTPVTLDVYTNTITLMVTDAGNADPLSVSVDTGTASSAGDFRWYDQSDTAGSNNIAGITVAAPTSTTLGFSNTY